MSESKMNYLLRDIDPVLWKAAKVYAAQNDTSLRSLLLDGLKDIVLPEIGCGHCGTVYPASHPFAGSPCHMCEENSK